MQKQTHTPQNVHYKLLLEGFADWLQLLGYSILGIPSLRAAVKDFLYHQETIGIASLQQWTAMDADTYIKLLQIRIGTRTGKPLSNAHINKQIQALKLFCRYIRETGRSLVSFNLQLMETVDRRPVWLTVAETARLYAVTTDTAIGIRDRAMLAVYYGCGLRLNEGANLTTKDIDQTTKLFHVRKGKHYKERLVPVAQQNFEEIMRYLQYSRPLLLQDRKHDCFFVETAKGNPLGKQSLYLRIKQLAQKAGLHKPVGTHTLRHSIATHLLQNGMKLEMIQHFLGHGDLDSTQIYTHLLNEPS